MYWKSDKRGKGLRSIVEKKQHMPDDEKRIRHGKDMNIFQEEGGIEIAEKARVQVRTARDLNRKGRKMRRGGPAEKNSKGCFNKKRGAAERSTN